MGNLCRLRRQCATLSAIVALAAFSLSARADDQAILSAPPAPLPASERFPIEVPSPTVDHVPSVDSGLHAELMQINQDFTQLPVPETIEIRSSWWDDLVYHPLRPELEQLPLTLEQILARALMHSKQVRVFSELPLIRETSITEADAAFDFHAFLDTRWDDTSDPIGSTLTAGPGITRFRDHHWTGSGGLRKRTYTGGNLELRQDFGFQDNNSQFFVPDPQGTSRIALSFTQPLMRGRGEIYNTSLICLAKIDAEVAHDEFARQLQSHLLEVTRAYWALYLERGVLYQKLNTYQRASEIVSWLEKRRAIDASESQIKAAQAALLERRSDLIRAQAAVKNAESRVRSLVNDPSFGNFSTVEIVPVDSPAGQFIPCDIHYAIAEAMQGRPEVTQAIKQIKAASVRLDMSKNELMPVLNLVTETYVAGLAADGDMGEAWTNQFNQGEPGYSVGLQFEVPLGNRAANARKQRRILELRQLQNQYEVTLQTVGLEVEVACREVHTSRQEVISKEQAVVAREEQLAYLTKRWERLPGEDLTASLMLENILNAQDRLANAEFEFLQARITYNLSLTNLKKAMGTLLQEELVTIGRTCVQGAPMQVVHKPDTNMSDAEFHLIEE